MNNANSVEKLHLESNNFSVSDKAAARIVKLLSENTNQKFFRIAVNAGGCSGFQYEFNLDDKSDDHDIILEKNGAKVVIDDISLGFLQNAQVEWVEELIGSSFKIVNPNARTSCGCGMSFSV